MVLQDYYRNCVLCPRKCSANRLEGQLGYCNTGNRVAVASVCLHAGEEPALSGNKGVCNVFFSRCNLQCIYCQNFQISNNRCGIVEIQDTIQVADRVCSILDTGVTHVGLVSASHQIVQAIELMDEIIKRGYQPVFIYNSNAYDLPESIDLIDPYIQIYLPDYKYSDSSLALKLSGASDYPEVADKALQRMLYHKGSKLICDNDEIAQFGIIVRHLVLPGEMQNSKNVLQTIAALSTKIQLSIMSQYQPTEKVKTFDKWNRTLFRKEYDEIVRFVEDLGFENFWIQDLESSGNYNPDFKKAQPFL